MSLVTYNKEPIIAVGIILPEDNQRELSIINSKLNQKIVMDEISKFNNNHFETLKFCKNFEKYLLILNKIIK